MDVRQAVGGNESQYCYFQSNFSKHSCGQLVEERAWERIEPPAPSARRRKEKAILVSPLTSDLVALSDFKESTSLSFL